MNGMIIELIGAVAFITAVPTTLRHKKKGETKVCNDLW